MPSSTGFVKIKNCAVSSRRNGQRQILRGKCRRALQSCGRALRHLWYWQTLLGDRVGPFEPALLEQRFDAWIPPPEIPVQGGGIDGTASREDHAAEALAILARQASVLAEPRERVVIEHLAPRVRVVAGGVSAVPDVREVGAVITRRDFRHIDVEPLERRSLKGIHVRRRVAGRQR